MEFFFAVVVVIAGFDLWMVDWSIVVSKVAISVNETAAEAALIEGAKNLEGDQ